MADDAILILTTGGTIDKVYFDALSAYQIGEATVTGILEMGRVTRPFVVEEVMRKDSLDVTDGDRARIVEHVARSSAHRVVVTHGTDTMTETARALRTVPGKVIVLVGALTPARFAQSDAAFNLGMAFAAVQVAQPGVYITMSGSVFPEGAVVKDRAAGAFTVGG